MLRKIARMMGYSLQETRRSEDGGDILYMALKLVSPTLILDCGANKGAFAQALRDVGYSGPVERVGNTQGRQV